MLIFFMQIKRKHMQTGHSPFTQTELYMWYLQHRRSNDDVKLELNWGRSAHLTVLRLESYYKPRSDKQQCNTLNDIYYLNIG